MIDAEFLIRDLPDPESARRFLAQLSEKNTSASKKLLANDALLSDVLLLVSYSPLIAATLLQHPEYLTWLDRERHNSSVRETPELLESLARFSLTNSQIEPHVTLSRFRRRELIRAFLRDIRRLATIAEITEEISNLADAVLEHALRIARQELDNRFGQPEVTDEKGRSMPAEFCIVSLGKLGSKELNYSSDIDLLFIYSDEGGTSGIGGSGTVTNVEYFSKLSEAIVKLVGRQGGEGAAYRVDMRLRPRGRIAPLAISLADAVRYYREEAAPWERQVLIRARASAGSPEIFKRFYAQIENAVYDEDQTVENALKNVRASKYKIDTEHRSKNGFNVKLGIGGIREIEFIAQALQLAYGGRDRWLRCPHTLICLSRLSDRGYVRNYELTDLFDAYTFLRGTEHILQMENGLQTHIVPTDSGRRMALGAKLGFDDLARFDDSLSQHTANVNRVFQRVFGVSSSEPIIAGAEDRDAPVVPSKNSSRIEHLRSVSRRATEVLAANPKLIRVVERIDEAVERDYAKVLVEAVRKHDKFREAIGELRREWTPLILEVIALDVFEKISLSECKRRQTRLAEASIEAATYLTRRELECRYDAEIEKLPLAVLGLGKLGGGGMDYDSDLDLVMVYEAEVIPEVNDSEFYSRAVEIFTNALSSITRDGSLYRVDLRLRPYGGKGPVAISRTAFSEYMRSSAAIWEMLAFVKLRAVGGDFDLAKRVEKNVREIIHARAKEIPPADLANETRSVRDRLEKQKTGRRRIKDIDIKYGPGGLLDVYFALRYLQLRYDIPDDESDRSTAATIERIADFLQESDRKGNGDPNIIEALNTLRDGHAFLSTLGHNLRLTVGRTSRVPTANRRALEVTHTRMNLPSTERLLDLLNLHRLSIRSAYERITDE